MHDGVRCTTCWYEMPVYGMMVVCSRLNTPPTKLLAADQGFFFFLVFVLIVAVRM